MKLRLCSLAAVLLFSGICVCWATEPETQAKVELSADEQAIFNMTNEAREKDKKQTLQPDPVLFQVARAHGANLAKKGVLSHVIDGKNPADRVRDAGYRFSWVAENIAAGYRWSPETTFQVWMNSQIHKTNIMDEKFRAIGISVVHGDNDQIYYVQVFAAPR